jgi:methyltransferase family protein/glycosyl transferase family 1
MHGLYRRLRCWAALAKRRVMGPVPWVSRAPAPRTDGSPPTVLVSVCENDINRGGYRYNGGIKLLNLWVQALRRHGYDAYMVTHDGQYQPWLIEHQPHVSLEQVKNWKLEGRPLRYMTGWVPARAFIELADSLYFLDAEMTYTCSVHLRGMKKLLKTKIRRVTTHSRTQQAWYMAALGVRPDFIPIWSDEAYWSPRPEVREPGLVGYMNEGPHTEKDIEAVAGWCKEAGVNASFLRISGDEAAVLEAMRRCDVYLGMNPGKHPLWGEGSPLTQQEAMHAGCVVIAYDVFGNREYLLDGYSGFLAPRGESGALAGHLIRVMRDQDLKERIRRNSTILASQAFTSTTRWPAVRNFLELPILDGGDCAPVRSGIVTEAPGACAPTRSQLETALGSTAYIHDSEIPVLCAYAAGCSGNVVEIGSAFGASATLILANVPSSAKVHSVDPFVPDSMSHGIHASESICRANVQRALRMLGRGAALDVWQLHAMASREAVAAWRGPVELLYLDGDHHYEAVREDLELWLPFVVPGGLILLHDSRRFPGEPCNRFVRGWHGPTRLAEELGARADLRLVDEAYSMTVWCKLKAAE